MKIQTVTLKIAYDEVMDEPVNWDWPDLIEDLGTTILDISAGESHAPTPEEQAVIEERRG